jgi:hypothetical protein
VSQLIAQGDNDAWENNGDGVDAKTCLDLPDGVDPAGGLWIRPNFARFGVGGARDPNGQTLVRGRPHHCLTADRLR